MPTFRRKRRGGCLQEAAVPAALLGLYLYQRSRTGKGRKGKKKRMTRRR
jgi:hypothetical protein